jgi:hypothetical protein
MNARILKSVNMVHGDTLEIIFKDDILIDLEGIKEAYTEFDTFFVEKKRLKRLVVIGKNTEITKDARKYGQAENKKRKSTCIAEAMVVHNFVQKVLTNFYLKYIEDLYPTKSFTDIDEARAWLYGFTPAAKSRGEKLNIFSF